MGKSMVSGVDFPLNQSIDCPKILKPTRRKSMEKPMYQWWKRDQWWFRWAFQRLAQRYPWFGTGTSPASSPSNPSNPSILVTTMPPWKVPGNLKLIFSSEVQSPAQVDQVVPIVQMLQRQMQQTQLHPQHPEVQAPQVKDVKEPKEPSDTGNRTRGTPLEPMVTVSWRIFRFTTAKTCLWTRSRNMDLRVSSTFFTCHGIPRVTPTRAWAFWTSFIQMMLNDFRRTWRGSTLTKTTRRAGLAAAACPLKLNVLMSRASSPTEPASTKNPTELHGCRPQSQWCHCWRLDNELEFPDAARKALRQIPWWKPRAQVGTTSSFCWLTSPSEAASRRPKHQT